LIDFINNLENHYNEYSYIGSIINKSMIEKNNKLDLNATLLYFYL